MVEAVLIEPDVEFISSVMRLGGTDAQKCFQCATCTATCTMVPEEYAFPRRQMLALQWGQKEKLLEDPSPWLCFYCGECSKTCPRQANPAETMMALRRFLTAQYDWTGISSLKYRSAIWEAGILLAVAALVVGLFTLPHNFGFGLLGRSGPAALAHVNLESFAPVRMVHLGDRILAAVLGVLLLSNAARMFRKLTRGRQIPLRCYGRHLADLVVQGASQVRWRRCTDPGTTAHWLRHLLLVTGYVTMFTLVVVFLPAFQVANRGFNWTALLGYYSTVALLAATLWMGFDRARKHTEMHRFSHASDWLFPALLFLTALSGILVHILRRADLPMPTYVMYTAHMAIAVPMLVAEVPFGKWTHLLYRPLAIFVAAAREEAEKSATGVMPTP